MIHFIQMREALVVIGSVRGCILLVGNLRQKEEYKEEKGTRKTYLGILFLGFTIKRKNIFGIYFRYLRTAKQGHERGSNCLEKKDGYVF